MVVLALFLLGTILCILALAQVLLMTPTTGRARLKRYNGQWRVQCECTYLFGMLTRWRWLAKPHADGPGRFSVMPAVTTSQDASVRFTIGPACFVVTGRPGHVVSEFRSRKDAQAAIEQWKAQPEFFDHLLPEPSAEPSD